MPIYKAFVYGYKLASIKGEDYSNAPVGQLKIVGLGLLFSIIFALLFVSSLIYSALHDDFALALGCVLVYFSIDIFLRIQE